MSWSEKDLKPCPFCGAECAAVKSEGFDQGGEILFVDCDSNDCDAQGPRRYSRADAITAWNARQETSRAGAGEPGALEELLKDPKAVHLNMLRGGIAKLTPAQIGHLYRGEEADEVIREVRRQNSRPDRTVALEEALTALVRAAEKTPRVHAPPALFTALCEANELLRSVAAVAEEKA